MKLFKKLLDKFKKPKVKILEGDEVKKVFADTVINNKPIGRIYGAEAKTHKPPEPEGPEGFGNCTVERNIKSGDKYKRKIYKAVIVKKNKRTTWVRYSDGVEAKVKNGRVKENETS